MPRQRRPASSSASVGAVAGASIRVVANRTGIAADTLRVWERRYGFPLPSRRPGGSRVYSEEDVARLRLIARALDAGFRPSEVVTLGETDLTKLVEASAADAPPRALTVAPSAPLGTQPVAALIEALLAEDVVGVRSILRAAAIALGPRAFVMDIAHPFAVRVGDLWSEGTLEVRHEHLAIASLTSQLNLLLGALEDGVRSPTVLLATLPAEPHVLGLHLVAVYLAASLAAPRLLGGDTPPSQITEAARAQRVDVVGLSISPAANRRTASRAAKAVAQGLPPGVELWLGGGGARGVAPAAPSARLVATWPELDAGLAAWRTR